MSLELGLRPVAYLFGQVGSLGAQGGGSGVPPRRGREVVLAVRRVLGRTGLVSFGLEQVWRRRGLMRLRRGHGAEVVWAKA